MTDILSSDPDTPMDKLLALLARATDPKNWIDVSDLTPDEFAEFLRNGEYADE